MIRRRYPHLCLNILVGLFGLCSFLLFGVTADSASPDHVNTGSSYGYVHRRPTAEIMAGQGQNMAGGVEAPLTAAAPHPLDSWSFRHPLPSGNPLYAVTRGKDAFLAVGFDTVLASPDGVAWTTVSLPVTDAQLCGAANGKNAFVAVGYTSGSTSAPLLLSSPDGSTWTEHASPVADGYLQGVAFGKDMFVAVGGKKKTGYPDQPLILTSPDGETWTEAGLAIDSGYIWGVTYGNGIFVAVGAGGSTILTSPDGIKWTRQAPSLSVEGVKGVAFGNGLFVAVGVYHDPKYRRDTPLILTSPDGISWTQRTSPVAYRSFNGVAFGNGAFVAVGSGASTFADSVDTHLIVASADGITWAQRTLPVKVGALMGVGYGGDGFVALGNYGTILTSSDTVTWTMRTARTTFATFYGAAYGKGVFVAAGQDRYDYSKDYAVVFSSSDGINWKSRAVEKGGFYGVTYGKGLFVATGYCSSEDYSRSSIIFTSSDGKKWTKRGLPATPYWWDPQLNGVTYGNGIFVAVGYAVTYPTEDSAVAVPLIYTSSDGITWTQRASGTGLSFNSVTYGNGVFVAAGLDNIAKEDETPHLVIATSPDGVTWTQASLPARLGALSSVTFGNGLFVAVGEVLTAISTNSLLTSPDGISWTLRALPDNAVFSGITSAKNIFVAVGGGNIFTSTDGRKWTQRNSGVATSAGLSGVTYSDGTFITVGKFGTVLQSMPFEHALSVIRSGTGSGRVTSKPAGISCGTSCSFVYAHGTTVTLTATSSATSTFIGWSGGGCSGTGPCTVPVNDAVTVTATFNAKPCTYAISPPTVSLRYMGATFNVNVAATGENCSPPNIGTPDGPWMSAEPVSFKANRGQVKVTVQPNDTISVRNGAIGIGAKTLKIAQAGIPCTLTLPSAGQTLTSSAQGASFSVISPAGCNWATAVASGNKWLTLTSGTGSGTGSVAYTVSQNTTTRQRAGTIAVFLSKTPGTKKVFTVTQKK